MATFARTLSQVLPKRIGKEIIHKIKKEEKASK